MSDEDERGDSEGGSRGTLATLGLLYDNNEAELQGDTLSIIAEEREDASAEDQTNFGINIIDDERSTDTDQVERLLDGDKGEGDVEMEVMGESQADSLDHPRQGEAEHSTWKAYIEAWFRDPISYLYISHFLSSWSDRLWGFAVPMIWGALFPQTLVYAAIFAFTMRVSCVFSGPVIGSWVDRNDRLYVVQISLVLQNMSVVVCSALMWFLFSYQNEEHPFSNVFFTLLFIATNLVGAIGTVYSMAEDIAVKKDWTVVLAQGRGPKKLSEINANMRRLNMICEIVAPTFFGSMFSFLGIKAGLALVFLWNVISFFPEWFILYKIYHSHSGLQKKSDAAKAKPRKNFIITTIEGWQVYRSQTVFLAGIAMVFLFITTLSPGVLLTTFLLTQGVNPIAIGVFRAFSAVSGLAATFLMTPMISKLGIIYASAISVCLQQLTLSPAGFSIIYSPEYPWLIYLFIASVVVSRCFLWSFDLGQTQIMQMGVAEEERGIVGGVQQSLCSMADLVTMTTAIFIGDPSNFPILVFLSYAAVTASATIFYIWSKDEKVVALFRSLEQKK